MVMGLPGSGKSTFCRRLMELDCGANNWIHVNQDELGKKEALKRASSGANRRNRLLVDRVHPTVADRQEWVEVLHSPPKGEIGLVYFAASADECTERVQRRLCHPTIPHGRGERIVQQIDRILEAPTQDERKNVFGMVEVVRSFEESNALLHKWTGVEVSSSNLSLA
mmetsp:Transcript_18669/g.31897  ORF Transcript_18669/g.31897 Transcript_18669/m.31897 type:complete len:167 (-) Transcript_18669:66-566(-)